MQRPCPAEEDRRPGAVLLERHAAVLEIGALREDHIAGLLARYGMRLVNVEEATPIPASYWGAPEAGLRGDTVYARSDTPVHSLLHELGHVVCMTGIRRAALDRDAKGDDDEECAVCYLQIVLADRLPGFGRSRCCDDMDAWGYSFREGTVRNWLAGDARDARAWLLAEGLIDGGGNPTWQLRE